MYSWRCDLTWTSAMDSLATKTSAMLPGTVTSCPRPIDSAISCDGLVTACASAGPAGAAASGASAHAALSTVFITRLFIVLPLTLKRLAGLSCAMVTRLAQRAQPDRCGPASSACPLGLAVEQSSRAAPGGFDGGLLAAGHADGRPGRDHGGGRRAAVGSGRHCPRH